MVKRKRSSFKKRKSTKRSKKRLTVTNVNNLLRFNDPTATTGFVPTGALTLLGGYMSHTTSSTAGTVNYGALAAVFKFEDLPGYAEMADMYESYRINKITLTFTPMATGASTGAAPSSVNTQMSVLFHYCLDYDDATIPAASAAGIQALRQRKGYRMRNIYAGAGKALKISFTPHLNINSQPRKAGWLDEGAYGLPHYGVKLITEAISAGTGLDHFFKVEARYHLSLKGIQ